MNNILIVTIFVIFVSLTITAYNLGTESRPEVVQTEKKTDRKIARSISPTNPAPPVLGVSDEGKSDFFSYTHPASWEQKKPVSGGILLFGPADSDEVWISFQDFTYINPDETPEMLAKKSAGKQTIVSSEEVVVDSHTGLSQTIKTPQGYKTEIFIGDVISYANFPQDGGDKKITGTHVISMETKNKKITEYSDIFDNFLSTVSYTIK